ncbi:MAG TPA: acetyltransferase [Polyangia bacterium]
MKRLAVLGAGGHAKVVSDAALLAGWDQVNLFADGAPVGEDQHVRWPILGDSKDLLLCHGDFEGVLVAIGDCEVRLAKHRLLLEAGARLTSVVHPRAWVSPYATLGVGSVLMAGAVVNVDATVGEACILNTGSTIDHDCWLGDAVHIAPGAHLSGNVTIGERSWIGIGATVKHGIRVGCGVTVGAGAVVVSHVDDGVTVMGVPARVRV